ncbi:MAG: hypothetical protein DRJ40_07360 [Thermoprotei archaeon]|nr:MAG: hypothetical protein DRJ40_07360 [Thermoprotei archaeon]
MVCGELLEGSSLYVIWDGHELIWSGDGREFLRGVGLRYLKHPFFEEGFKRLLTEWKPRKRYRVCLFLPCAYGKPYSQSYIHYFIIRALKSLGRYYEDIHQVIITNAGIVPRELEEYYPYCAYDWNPKYETSEVKVLYREVTCERLRLFLSRFRSYYECFVSYLRWDSDSYAALERACSMLGIEVKNLAARVNEVPPHELDEVSLGGYYDDPDLILITPTSLSKLISGLREILSARCCD